MELSIDKLKPLLLESNIMTEKQFEIAEKAAESEGISFQNYILEQDYISDEQFGQVISNYLNIPFVSLSSVSIPNDVLNIIPEIYARKQKVIAFKRDDKGLHIATSEVGNIQIVNLLKKKIGDPIVVYYATNRDIKEALSLYAKDVAKAFEDIISESIEKAKSVKGKLAEPPIIKIVETIIMYSYRNKASDVHIEPEEEYSLVRFRIDGILHSIVKLPIEIHNQVITRVKVLSDLRTDEHRVPQDGRISQKVDEEDLNIRVSIVPVTEGEKVVLRLLSERTRRLSLSVLGLAKTALERVTKAYKKPYGMILVTGPTGSGKTTTLYAILKVLNKPKINIMTIEDPVEYDVAGVNQIQVNPKAGLTFASGLRSIVRQDPDLILVVEIRDKETAGIAVNSAMTGHLVLSTLHTNNAATSVPRLFDMGVEPYLVASSVNVIVAQRLVREICEKCRTSIDLTSDKWEGYKKSLSAELIKKHFGTKKAVRIYQGKGCDICHHTGYVGRVGIYEVLEVDEDIQKAIVDKKDAEVINKLAISKGMIPMIGDGLEKVKLGVTTMEEVIRVTKE